MEARLPAPHPLIGDNLTAELAAAGVDVTLVEHLPRHDQVRVEWGGAAAEDLVHTVVAAHTGLPAPAQQQRATDRNVTRFGVPAARKARDVLTGQAAYTTEEADRLLARLVLRAHLDDAG